MKKLYLTRVVIMALIVIATTSTSHAQCPAGASRSVVNWDNLDYLTQNGSYAGYVTTSMMQNQKFTMGSNRITISFPVTSMTTSGENTVNTAEAGSYGVGADVEYKGNGSITITFDTVVNNLKFSLYDLDSSQKVRITALDGTAIPLPLNISANAVTPGILTVSGSGTSAVDVAAISTAVANTDNRGTLNVDIAGNNPLIANGVKSLTLQFGISGGVAGNFWLSELTACVFGTFPLNYYVSQQPFIGQPAYYMVTPDNNSVYLFNPLSGKADLLFSEPASPWVNSLAYDHVNKFLYYVMDHPSPLLSNKSVKKYDFNTETISTVIPDLTAFDIPLFDIVVESAGAAFYNGSLFIGVEGTNSGKNSSRECIIWRIDFDATQKPIRASQVFAFPADNGAGLLTHDWGDFTIKDGMLFDFNTGNSGSTSSFIHYNMQNDSAVSFSTNGAPAPIQAGQTWNGRLYWTGGQAPESGRVALYNENGTIGTKIPAVATSCSPAWVGRAGDASDPFRPKSDFGDAPASYDPVPNDKATHEYDCNLRFGATFDKEWDKTPSANATADGTDEDGIATVTTLRRGTINFVQDIQVFNNTGAAATVAGWLDIDGNGLFDAAEGRTISVPTNASMQTVTLSWTGINITLPYATTTFMRIRITSASNNMSTSNPTRWMPNGEVEDYPVFVNAILPVQLLAFTATPESNNRVLLNWKTGNEINFKGFDVERSKDGLNWQRITFVQSANLIDVDNDYFYYDEKPLTGKSYYRLRLIYSDGNYKYSEVRSVQMKEMNSDLRLTPNPVTLATTLQFTHNKLETVTVFILDVTGKRIMKKQVTVDKGLNEIYLDKLDQFVAGVYVVQVVTGSEILNTRMVVQ